MEKEIEYVNHADALEILKKTAKQIISDIKREREKFNLSKKWCAEREKLCREFIKLNEINKTNLLKYWFVVLFSGVIDYANRPAKTSDKMYLESDLPLLFKKV